MSSIDVKFYKKNFDSLAKIPFVKQLLKENKKLEKENAELKNTVFKLCKRLLEKEETSIKSQDVLDIEVEVLETPKKENIVYEIEEDDEFEIKVKSEIVEEEDEFVDAEEMSDTEEEKQEEVIVVLAVNEVEEEEVVVLEEEEE